MNGWPVNSFLVSPRTGRKYEVSSVTHYRPEWGTSIYYTSQVEPMKQECALKLYWKVAGQEERFERVKGTIKWLAAEYREWTDWFFGKKPEPDADGVCQEYVAVIMPWMDRTLYSDILEDPDDAEWDPWVPRSGVTAFVYDLLRTVNNLHKIGFVHGDIRPENILLTQDDTLRTCRPVLCGFSLAQSMTNLTQYSVRELEEIDGAGCFVPDILLETRKPSRAADVIALARTLEECLEVLDRPSLSRDLQFGMTTEEGLAIREILNRMLEGCDLSECLSNPVFLLASYKVVKCEIQAKADDIEEMLKAGEDIPSQMYV